MMKELNAVGGGFMSQLEWGSDSKEFFADIMESFSIQHLITMDQRKLFYATEADVQALLTQLFMTWLSGGNPPLFMDFRKVWEPMK